MKKLSALTTAVIALVALIAPATPVVAQSSITCGPLDNGRVADVFYKSNAVFFDPVVEYEYELAVLTVAGPCETLTKTFKPGEEIFFDLAEVKRTLDGQYEWELRFMPAVDPGVRDELQASRGTGEEDDVWWSFWQKGAIPDGPRVDNAGFTVVKGSIIDPNSGEERQKSSTVATKGASAPLAAATAGFDASGGTSSSQEASGAGEGGNVLATKDFVINDDLIVIGSQCLGFDCINGEVFNFDTLRLKENNLRIKFQDTSGGSFPTRDWEIEANSSANGGQTHFRINDVDAGRSPFTVEGSSPSHSLYVDSSGRVGFGTSNPVVELHSASGDTPTLRLDQNTSQGFASQVWDIAGNETSFFVRDTTGGSTLPFRIRPGASSNSLVIDGDSEVGIGTLSPQGPLHIKQGSDDVMLVDVGGTAASGTTQQLFSPDGSSGTFFSQALDSGLVVFGAQTNSNFAIRTNATTDVIRITTVPRVGILNTSPLHPLQVGTDSTNGNGAHVTASGVWTNGSSRKNKTDIRDVDPDEALSALDQIRPVRYYGANTTDEEEYLGFIAEEVPDLVAMNDRESLASMDVVAMLTAVVKEQRKIIEQLEARVEAIESSP